MIKLFKTTNQNDSWGAFRKDNDTPAHWIKTNCDIWWVDSSFDDKETVKAAGFSFHWKKMKWFTHEREKAAKLAEFAVDIDIRNDLTGLKIHQNTSLEGSRAASTNRILLHPEGCEYLPFQNAGIEYMIARSNTLLADDMGLGKTIQALGYINNTPEVKTVLVICPNTVKYNWMIEAKKWLNVPGDDRNWKYAIGDTKTAPLPEYGYNFVIFNYDPIKKREINNKVWSVSWDLLIIDEVHHYKNPKTISYKSLVGDKDRGLLPINAKRMIFATGTPLENCVYELYPLLVILDPDYWKEKSYYYYKRYCNYDKKGCNIEKLPELQQILRERIMIRRMKQDVLTELPGKRRNIILLKADSDDYQAMEAIELGKRVVQSKNTEELEVMVELSKAEENEIRYQESIEALENTQKYAFEEMAAVRIATAKAKIPYVIRYIEDQLENVDKIVVICWHHEVINAITNHWPLESMSIHGGTKPHERQQNVDRFQTDPLCRLAVIGPAGFEGITLTAAYTCDVIELPWKPGQLDQAEDRLNRIGQKNCVDVNHLLLEDSIDIKMAKTIISKQKVIDATINDEAPEKIPKEIAATRSLTREKIIAEANDLDRETIPYIHEALKFICGNDLDRASALNGIGFNMIDSRIGHSLAESPELTAKQAVLGRRLCKKYRGQISEELYKKIFGKPLTKIEANMIKPFLDTLKKHGCNGIQVGNKKIEIIDNKIIER